MVSGINLCLPQVGINRLCNLCSINTFVVRLMVWRHNLHIRSRSSSPRQPCFRCISEVPGSDQVLGPLMFGPVSFSAWSHCFLCRNGALTFFLAYGEMRREVREIWYKQARPCARHTPFTLTSTNSCCGFGGEWAFVGGLKIEFSWKWSVFRVVQVEEKWELYGKEI